MWDSKNVERALFSWWRWQHSIINQWVIGDHGPVEGTYEEFRDRVQRELSVMELPVSNWLEIYWICCVCSNYTITDRISYKNILMHDWLMKLAGVYLKSYKIETGTRVYPPEVWNERDIDIYALRYFGKNLTDKSILYPNEGDLRIFLPTGHEFYEVLKKFKGRPRVYRKRGKRPHYSDRLAVHCAVEKDKREMTYIEIAKRFDLPRTKPWESWQSDVARHLVNRGRRLIQSLDDSNSLP